MKKNTVFKAFFITSFLLMILVANQTYAQGKGKGHEKHDKHEKHEGKRGGPPSWAPAHGYRAKTRHVYFSKYQTYYDIQKQVYIYLSSGTWKVSASIPTFLQGVNLGATSQVELDLNMDTPQIYFEEHKKKHK